MIGDNTEDGCVGNEWKNGGGAGRKTPIFATLTTY